MENRHDSGDKVGYETGIVKFSQAQDSVKCRTYNIEFEKRVAELKERKRAGAKKLIVNAGLLKAGKSTLFNALLGETVFASDVVRTTIKNEKKEVEGYFLLDTPGLDANEQDTKEAMTAYEEAEAIVFVHNLQEGEFNQVEIDSIEKICRLYGDKRAFFQKTVLALSHKDQVEEQYPDICRKIEEQCQGILKGCFCKMVCVDSEGYLKGVKEDKELLKKVSGIPELMEALRDCVLNGADLQSGRLKKERDELIAEIDAAIEGLKKQMPEECEVSGTDIARAAADMKAIQDRGLRGINGKVSLPEERNYDNYFGVTDFGVLDNKKYKSKYDAESAGESTLKKKIERIASAVRKDSLDMVKKAEYYINLGQGPKEILDKLSDIYEEMRQCALKAGVAISTNFAVSVRDPWKVPGKANGWGGSDLEEAVRELSRVRDHARDIGANSFSSASRYIKNGGIFIDSDVTEEEVKGIFGYKWKQVWYYSYDIEGALINVSHDGWNLAFDLKCEIRDIDIDRVFRGIKSDLEEQFKDLTDKIFAEMAEKKKKAETQEQEHRKKVQAVQEQIAELERCRKTAAGI